MAVDRAPATAATVSGAQTLLRALDILDSFTTLGASLSLAEISRSVGLTMPTTHRLLKALVLREMVVEDRSRRYSLGPAVMRLASTVMGRANELVTLATPVLERIRAATGETASLHCVLGESRVCVAELVSPEPIRMESGVGHVYPLHAGAAGKVLVAWDAALRARVPAILAAAGPSAPTSPERLEQELALVRRRGYATSAGEVVAGAAALAVPVFADGGRVAGAINVAGPANRWTRKQIARHVSDVLEEARALTALLAGSKPPLSR